VHDPSVLQAPTGQAVDGRRLLGAAVVFGRELRREGLQIDLGAAVDFARALTLVDVADRSQVKGAGEAIFVRRRDDRVVYERVFERFWRRGGVRLPWEMPPAPTVRREDGMPTDEEGEPTGEVGERAGDDLEVRGAPVGAGELEEVDEEPDSAVQMIAPDAFSASEILRHRDFDRMTAAELRDAEKLVDLLAPRLEKRRTRRYELHHHGRLLAPRAMFRRNLATGGQLTDWVWRRHVRRPRPLVVLCDISGSMERHSRLLLRFVQALSASSEVRTESFVFGTRLTRVTRLLRDRDRDRALGRVAQTVTDWAGGTRIGESFREFNLRWARRTLRSSAVVIVVSDGWDRGDPALVATETARLRRQCHRLVWLNPLAGTPGYQPLAAGMRAAYPYIDDFLPAGTVASLERLGEILAGVRTTDNRRSGEAAAGVTSPETARPLAPPEVLDAKPADPFAARPLTR
jgi:uncharacterized protein with von Willebrand factor type A (vWA) domain